MKLRKDHCVICGIEIEIHILNEAWCENCIEVERARNLREDWRGSFTSSRPPKYVIPKDQWAAFGYK